MSPERALVPKAAAFLSAPLAPEEFDWQDAGRELRLLVPKSFSVRHGLVPVSLHGDLLRVAMARPEDWQALQRLRLITRCRVQPLLASAAKVKAAIARLYAS